MTLIALAAVLAVKYGASVRMVKMQQEQAELENTCRDYKYKYRALMLERRAAETEERELRGNVQTLESRLEALRMELTEQEVRNVELQERLLDKKTTHN